jgi:hypothetical protein
MVRIAPGAEPKERSYSKECAKRAFSTGAMVGVGAGATFQHAINSPREWGRGAAGFGKRVGSVLGKHLIDSSIQFTVATIRHEDLNYHPSGKPGFRPRLQHALLSTVITRKTTTGKQTVASNKIAGAVGSGFISRLWQPARLHTVASGAESAGITLGVQAGTNVVREFWPEIRHPHQH